MWSPFERRNSSGEPPPPPPAPSAAEKEGIDAANLSTTSHIAELELMGRTAVATLTVTELSQECGAEQLASLLMELAETGAVNFVLDMEIVQFMDTTCLGVLVEALNRLSARGGGIAIAKANHSVSYIFRLTRLDRVFRISPNVMAAIDAVEARLEAS